VNTPHPELEALAELADPAIPTTGPDDPEAAHHAELLAHVADCGRCQADLSALREVQQTLRSLPPIPMPDDVAARIEAALAVARLDGEESSAATAATAAGLTLLPVASERTPSRWRPAIWHGPFPLNVAAAVVGVLVIGVGGWLAIKAVGNSGAQNKTASTAAGPAVLAQAPTITSGTAYTTATIRGQIAGVVNQTVPGASDLYGGLNSPQTADGAAAGGSSPASAPHAAASASAAASTAASAAGPSAPAARPDFGTRSTPSGPLADPAALQRCVDILAGQPAKAVLVDYATFDGKPATIIVLPDPANASQLIVYVEDDDIDCSKEAISFVAVLPPK
jgi:hypothetical protein